MNSAAKRVNAKYQAAEGDNLSKFDPTWITIVVQILSAVLKNCDMPSTDIPAAAKAGNSFFWRLFGKGRIARLAVEQAVHKTTYGGGKSLRRQSAGLVDAVLAVGADSHPYEIQDAQREAKNA